MTAIYIYIQREDKEKSGVNREGKKRGPATQATTGTHTHIHMKNKKQRSNMNDHQVKQITNN